MLKVQVINKSKHPLPQYATELSAGMDLRANLSEPIVLKPLQRCLVPTGLFMALPPGFENLMFLHLLNICKNQFRPEATRVALKNE